MYLILGKKPVHATSAITSHHELKIVDDDVGNVEDIDGVSHGVQNFVNLKENTGTRHNVRGSLRPMTHQCFDTYPGDRLMKHPSQTSLGHLIA